MPLGFNCPSCGETTAFEEGTDPEDVEKRIYKCEGCGENILCEGPRETAQD